MRDQRKWRELQHWIENNRQIKWLIEENPQLNEKTENIVIAINKLSKRPLLHHNPVEIFDELFQWRQDYIDGKRRRL